MKKNGTKEINRALGEGRALRHVQGMPDVRWHLAAGQLPCFVFVVVLFFFALEVRKLTLSDRVFTV